MYVQKLSETNAFNSDVQHHKIALLLVRLSLSNRCFRVQEGSKSKFVKFNSKSVQFNNKMMFLRSVFLALLATAVSADYIRKVESSSTCFCTTVPCPVVGTNVLVEGKITYSVNNFQFLKI